MSTRVIGIGQPAAGDDGVGHAVIDALAAMILPAGTEIVRARESSALVELYAGAARVIVTDALMSSGAPELAPGTVHVLGADSLSRRGAVGVSSHGINAVRALDMARVLFTDVPDDVWFVAVSIDAPTTYGYGLSEPVARAVPLAARAIAELIQEGS